MAAAQHTPGPWQAETQRPLDNSTVWSSSEYVLDTASPIASCRDFDEVRPVAECQANARLIAAAPDLLVQLKGALAVANHVISSTGIDAEHTALQMVANGEQFAVVLLSTLIENAAAAIAKAEGRS